MIVRSSQNIRPDDHPKSAATPSLLAERLREAMERHRAKQSTQGETR